MDVFVNAEGLDDGLHSSLEAAVRRALSAGSADTGTAEVSVTLVDDERIRALNREYLDRDTATDVIAFGLDGPGLLGDVYIGVDRARDQAEQHGVTLEEELVRLAIHGTLHVLGHDHPDGPERLDSPMFEIQERLVREVMAGR